VFHSLPVSPFYLSPTPPVPLFFLMEIHSTSHLHIPAACSQTSTDLAAALLLIVVPPSLPLPPPPTPPHPQMEIHSTSHLHITADIIGLLLHLELTPWLLLLLHVISPSPPSTRRWRSTAPATCTSQLTWMKRPRQSSGARRTGVSLGCWPETWVSNT
jgi:hypothetical protein